MGRSAPWAAQATGREATAPPRTAYSAPTSIREEGPNLEAALADANGTTIATATATARVIAIQQAPSAV
jgi:hypothetical protein